MKTFSRSHLKSLTLVLLLTLLTMLFLNQTRATHAGATGPTHGKNVVMYYPDWAGNPDISAVANRITHIQYAFVNLDANGNCVAPASNSTINYLNNLKTNYPHLKLIFSIGGWTWSDHFSDVAKDAGKRSQMVSSCLSLMRNKGFDGLDFDWEHPVVGGEAGNSTDPNDDNNYVTLLQEFRVAMNTGEELSVATSAAGWVYANMNLGAMATHLDHINIMTYDFHGGWASFVFHHSQLYRNPLESANNNGNQAVSDYIAAGVPSNKIVMGVAFYGHGWQNVPDGGTNGLGQSGSNGFTRTYDQINNLIGTNGYTRYWDDIAKVPYLYSPTANGGSFIGYDDAQSICAKADYVNNNNLGGLMAWELTQNLNDDDLIAAIDSCLGGSNPPAPTATPNAPAPTATATQPAPTGDCTSPAWDATAVYLGDATLGTGGGEVVIYNGREYRALWWTQGDIPADTSVWGDLGTCSGGTAPTSTPLPLPTDTPPPTSTPVPTIVPAGSIYIADLDGLPSLAGKRWNAVVTVMVVDENSAPISGVTVTGEWRNGAGGTSSCTTGSNGLCQLNKNRINSSTTQVTLDVLSVSHSALTYDASMNRDSDGDSNGTTIVVYKDPSVPDPTETPLPTATQSAPDPTTTPIVAATSTPPAPTPTIVPSGGQMHISNIEAITEVSGRNKWNMEVKITVVDETNSPLSGVTVAGYWSGGTSGESSCMSDANGQCSVSRTGLSQRKTVSFTVSDMTRNGYNYDADANAVTSVTTGHEGMVTLYGIMLESVYFDEVEVPLATGMRTGDAYTADGLPLLLAFTMLISIVMLLGIRYTNQQTR